MSSSKKQQTIDFGTRGQRLRLLDRVRLPDDIARTSPAAMLAVLRCLDSHARDGTSCRVSAVRISAETGYSRRSVDRALIALEGLVLLSRKRTGGSSIYAICWGNLQEFVPAEIAKGEAESTSNARRESGHHVQSEWTPCLLGVDTMSNQSGHHVHSTEAYLETPFETPPPPPGRSEPGWPEAEAAVAACGVDRVREAIRQAQAGGVDAGYVLACVAWFRQCGQPWGKGALYDRLCQATPHVSPERGWPSPRPMTARETRCLGLLEAIRAHFDQLDDETLRAKFELVAKTDPQRAPPGQAEIASRHGCPFDDLEISRAWFFGATLTRRS